MFPTSAHAQSAGAAGGSGGIVGALVSFAPLILIFVAFWFLMIRPQQKRMKQLREAVAAVKKGDQVVTGGGLVGKVTKVEEDFVEIELSPGNKVRAVKSTLTEVSQPGSAKPAND